MHSNLPKIDVVIRKACETDINKICEVLTRSVREVCAKDYGNNEEILAEWCSNKTPDVVSSWLKDPTLDLVVAILPPHGIVGAGMYQNDKSDIHLCYLVPEGLHKGIGTRLLAKMEEFALKKGHTEITLHSSITAQDFYLRHGYMLDGEQTVFRKIVCFPMRKVLV